MWWSARYAARAWCWLMPFAVPPFGCAMSVSASRSSSSARNCSEVRMSRAVAFSCDLVAFTKSRRSSSTGLSPAGELRPDDNDGDHDERDVADRDAHQY